MKQEKLKTIVYLIPSPDSGMDGIRDYTINLVGKMAHEFYVHVLTSKHGKVHFEKIAGITIHPLWVHWNLFALFSTLVCVARTKADILHIQFQAFQYSRNPSIMLLPFVAKAICPKVKIVTTFHDLDGVYPLPALCFEALKHIFGIVKALRKLACASSSDMAHAKRLAENKLFRWLLDISIKKIASASDRIILTNHLDRQKLSVLFPNIAEKIVQIPVGSNIPLRKVSEGCIAAIRSSFAIKNDEIILLFFGFPGGGKGLQLLISAFRLALEKTNQPIRLVIAGEIKKSNQYETKNYERIISMINELQLPERIIWTGKQHEETISALFALACLTILPYDEGVTYRRGSFAAAATHGSPIVTTVAGELPEELKHGENILAVSPNSPEDLAQMIIILLNDVKLRSKLARNIKHIASIFSWDHIVDETKIVYKGLR